MKEAAKFEEQANWVIDQERLEECIESIGILLQYISKLALNLLSIKRTRLHVHLTYILSTFSNTERSDDSGRNCE